jgi:hypothetical protein
MKTLTQDLLPRAVIGVIAVFMLVAVLVSPYQ